MEEEDEEDKMQFSFGGGGGRKKSSKPPPPAPPGINDEKYPTDLPPGAKKPDFEWPEQEGGVIREVMDQGNRRVCWTVAASRELSGRLVAAGRFDPPLCFSPLHFLVGLIDKTGGLNNLDHLRTFLMEEGAILEEDCSCPQPALDYKTNKSKPKPVLCTEHLKAKHVRKFKVEDLTIKETNEVDEREIMRLLKTGPVTVGIDVHEDFTRFKGDGIFPGPRKGSYKIDEHLFIVRGYGTKMPEGIHFWKVQNSTGHTWGENGYGKIIRQISRNKGEPSLFTRIVTPTLLDHYDGQNEHA